MDWLNLHTSILDSPDVVGAEPLDRGTWLMLLRFCIGQENGGSIADCGGWKDRKWQQLARVTLAEVKRESELWCWNDGCLIVWGYPAEKETEVRAKREVAKTNGKSGGRPKKNPEETNIGFYQEPEPVFFEKAEGEGKEKGKEWNGMEAPPTPQGGRCAGGDFLPPVDEEELTIDVLKARINSLRPQWKRPVHWNHAEDRLLHEGTAGQMQELTADDWETLRLYLEAKGLSEKEFWRPNNRSQFVKCFPDIFSSALRWAGTSGAMPKPKLNGIWK